MFGWRIFGWRIFGWRSASSAAIRICFQLRLSPLRYLPLNSMTRIAIIGGGISGLSAAFALEMDRRAGVNVDYVLYEASTRLVVALLTNSIDGYVVPPPPHSFIPK